MIMAVSLHLVYLIFDRFLRWLLLVGRTRMSQVPWNFGGGPVIIRRL